MRVYVSASSEKKAREAALLLGPPLGGHEIVSTWHADGIPRLAREDAAGWTARVKENLADIARAEVVVCIPANPAGSFGAQVEIGYAVGRGVPVVVFALRLPSALLRHTLIHHVTTADGLEATLTELAGAVTATPKVKATRRKVPAVADIAR